MLRRALLAVERPVAPTVLTRQRLLDEAIDPARVVVTGNTVVDALQWAIGSDRPAPDGDVLAAVDPARTLVLVTMHRRESWGAPMEAAAQALSALARSRPDDVAVLVPQHPNPVVRQTLGAALGSLANVTLCEPLTYLTFARALARAAVVVTDSGGVQEEAALA